MKHLFLQYQKQRPNVERVAACIRQHHPQYSNETVHQVCLHPSVWVWETLHGIDWLHFSEVQFRQSWTSTCKTSSTGTTTQNMAAPVLAPKHILYKSTVFPSFLKIWTKHGCSHSNMYTTGFQYPFTICTKHCWTFPACTSRLYEQEVLSSYKAWLFRIIEFQLFFFRITWRSYVAWLFKINEFQIFSCF